MCTFDMFGPPLLGCVAHAPRCARPRVRLDGYERFAALPKGVLYVGEVEEKRLMP
jgi:hypothetical protein